MCEVWEIGLRCVGILNLYLEDLIPDLITKGNQCTHDELDHSQLDLSPVFSISSSFILKAVVEKSSNIFKEEIFWPVVLDIAQHVAWHC